jgi:exonuclease III
MGLCDEYDDHWSCSTAKKGYSGTAVFVRRRSKSNGIMNDSDNASNAKVKGAKKQTSMLQFVKAKAKDDDVDNKDDVVSKKNETICDETLPIDIKQLIPSNIAYIMGKEKHDKEGRLIVVDFPLFTLCNVYVPNAGQQLDRLSYRVNEWDKDFLNFIHQKQKDRDGLPVIWLGDLNVAHTNLEVWNDGAKHLAKQAGVTCFSFFTSHSSWTLFVLEYESW